MWEKTVGKGMTLEAGASMSVQNVGDREVLLVPAVDGLVIIGDVKCELKNIGADGVSVHMYRMVKTGDGSHETYEIGWLEPGEVGKY